MTRSGSGGELPSWMRPGGNDVVALEPYEVPGFALKVPSGWKRRFRTTADEHRTSWTAPDGIERVTVSVSRGDARAELADFEEQWGGSLLPAAQRELPASFASELHADLAFAFLGERPGEEEDDPALRDYVLIVARGSRVISAWVTHKVKGDEGEALARGVLRSLRLSAPEGTESAVAPALPKTASSEDPPSVVETGGGVSKNGVRRVYRVLCHLAACDGSVEASEARVLTAFRAKRGISADEGEALAREGERGEKLSASKSPPEQALLLESMIEVVLADGRLDPEEERRVRKLAQSMGLSTDDIRARLRAARPKRSSPAQAAAAPVAPAPLPVAPVAGGGLADAFAAVQELMPCFVVLLDAPKERAIVDLASCEIKGGFRGFAHVPPGLHRVAVRDGSRDVAVWLTLEGGDVAVKAFDAGTLVDADAERRDRYGPLARAGRMTDALMLYPAQVNADWATLVAPLRGRPFPPRLHAKDAGTPAMTHRLERAWRGTHAGDGRALTAELAWSFLTGLLDEDHVAFDRWKHLLQSTYHCGEDLPKRDPALFVSLVDLIIAQLKQLPPASRSSEAITFASDYLSTDLIDTEVPELVAAGRRFAAFMGSTRSS